MLGVHSIGWFMPLVTQYRAFALIAAGRCARLTLLVAERCKGNERYGHLNDHRAEREQPNLSLGLRIHRSPNVQRHGLFQGSRTIRRRACIRTMRGEGAGLRWLVFSQGVSSKPNGAELLLLLPQQNAHPFGIPGDPSRKARSLCGEWVRATNRSNRALRH